MSDKTLDKFFDGKKRLFAVSQRLEGLANSFYNTGNTTVGDRLVAFAEMIDAAAEDMYSAMSESLSEQLKRSQENSATILKSVMAGIELGKETDDDEKVS